MSNVILPTMIREAEAHLPFEVKTAGNQARWEWLADYLTKAIAEPNKPCECCGATPQGDIMERPEDRKECDHAGTHHKVGPFWRCDACGEEIK